ncbi:MAG TPA: peroxiredoxin [Methylomirabilota bacterium]|nr:peroxiredoxin [Methylomirabilota bacterium]
MTAPIAEGTPAPDFTLPTPDGEPLSLSSLRGKPVVVYFYPKDDTSGCTKEAIDFTALKDEFAAIGAIVIGISPDNVASHEKFAKKHDLDLVLAADEERVAIEAFGVWAEKSMYGRKYMGVDRSTFLIDRDGTVAKVWRKVKVPGHAEEVLAAAKAL